MYYLSSLGYVSVGMNYQSHEGEQLKTLPKSLQNQADCENRGAESSPTWCQHPEVMQQQMDANETTYDAFNIFTV